MPRTQKDSHARELEEEEHVIGDAPRVHESEVEDDEHAQASLWTDKRASFEDDDEHEPELEDLDFDDLYAMEGPDA